MLLSGPEFHRDVLTTAESTIRPSWIHPVVTFRWLPDVAVVARQIWSHSKPGEMRSRSLAQVCRVATCGRLLAKLFFG
jgi:hypothetical protein